MAAPTVVLNNGLKIPALGLGTWLAPPGKVQIAVQYAIDVGYRMFDCAWLYGNEREVGEGLREAIKAKKVKREDIFVTTKLWNTFHATEDVVPACKASLKNFGFDYVDLYLIHWPCAQKNTGKVDVNLPFKDAVNISYDFVNTWKGMEECANLGLAKSIGLSNFNKKQLDRVLGAAKIKPVMNQIEVNPNLNQKKLIEFCKDRGVSVTAYSPFGSPKRPWAKPGDPILNINDPKLVEIGKKYKKSSAQVVLRYLIQLGVIPIPKSSRKERIKDNINVFDFKLTKDEMHVVDSFNCNGRAVHAEELKESPDYPFRDEDN